MTTLTPAQESCREAMLEALVAVLERVPGVRLVERQGITAEMVSEAELPAIIIEESGTTGEWLERHGGRTMELTDTIVLDVQVFATRGRRGRHTASTVRERFVHAIVAELAEAATLVCQLPGEDAPRAHARDVLSTPPRVRYLPTDGDHGRALLTLQVQHHQTYDRRARTAWLELLMELDIKPDYERGPGAPPTTITTTIDED